MDTYTGQLVDTNSTPSAMSQCGDGVNLCSVFRTYLKLRSTQIVYPCRRGAMLSICLVVVVVVVVACWRCSIP